MNPSSSSALSEATSRILIRSRSQEDALAQAQAIAGSRGKPLQTVSLAQVVSGYLRETEKRLLALLDTAEESGAILFFEDASALFGNRTDRTEPADPLIDVPFFLQCIENFPGSVIVAIPATENLNQESVQRLQFTLKN